MTYKLNILEPWESGTESAVRVTIIKETENQFLLFLEKPIQIKGQDAYYFICELQKKEDKNALTKKMKGVYPINMVFDQSINENSQLPPLSSYRANFLSGEIVV
jgi:hypothetical protein